MPSQVFIGPVKLTLSIEIRGRVELMNNEGWRCHDCQAAITIPDPLQDEIVRLLGNGGASAELVQVETYVPLQNTFQIVCRNCGSVYSLHVKPARTTTRA